ncbi:unnamed protein product [marine sediment metagenome]|uniref:Aminotransferase class V domain-containing protein n=1 Tax=marine sediment metagenome TaxID=412755 RepID=X1TJU1_9ZZZZ
MVMKYWGSERLYHHTAPVNMIYGLHEALRIVAEERLEARWKRHMEVHKALKAGLEGLGLTYIADRDHQLAMLNAVATPEGVDEGAVRKALLEKFSIEIGGGLGDFKGKAWRIGIMGESATQKHVSTLLSALKELLPAG